MGNLFRSSKVTKKVLQHVNDLLVSPASVLHNIYIIPIIFIQKPLNDTIAVEEECIKQLIWFHLVLFYSSLPERCLWPTIGWSNGYYDDTFSLPSMLTGIRLVLFSLNPVFIPLPAKHLSLAPHYFGVGQTIYMDSPSPCSHPSCLSYLSLTYIALKEIEG